LLLIDHIREDPDDLLLLFAHLAASADARHVKVLAASHHPESSYEHREHIENIHLKKLFRNSSMTLVLNLLDKDMLQEDFEFETSLTEIMRQAVEHPIFALSYKYPNPRALRRIVNKVNEAFHVDKVGMKELTYELLQNIMNSLVEFHVDLYPQSAGVDEETIIQDEMVQLTTILRNWCRSQELPDPLVPRFRSASSAAALQVELESKSDSVFQKDFQKSVSFDAEMLHSHDRVDRPPSFERWKTRRSTILVLPMLNPLASVEEDDDSDSLVLMDMDYNETDPLKWTPEDVGNYISNISKRFEQYRQVIEYNGIDGSLMEDFLTDPEEMMQLGIEDEGDQLRIMERVKRLLHKSPEQAKPQPMPLKLSANPDLLRNDTLTTLLADEPSEWSAKEVGNYLYQLDSSFGKYRKAIMEHNIDGASMLQIFTDAESMLELGIDDSLQVQIQRHVSELFSAGDPSEDVDLDPTKRPSMGGAEMSKLDSLVGGSFLDS